ncbi:hypothetical protein MHBO_003638, partial [Bonamia ostreae]
FNFRGRDQSKLVGDLSGGEKNRVGLAKVLLNNCNVLLLDEPSNDLDIITLTALESSLKSFGGCVVCISHDRYFLNKICTHIIEVRSDGRVRLFNGNYDFYKKNK